MNLQFNIGRCTTKKNIFDGLGSYDIVIDSYKLDLKLKNPVILDIFEN